jgi:glycosyltransferase involved in cell wall biosynthesis
MQKIAFIIFDLFVINNCDKIIVLSKKMEKDLISRWGIKPEKVKVIYNGVDSEAYNIDKFECKDVPLKFDIHFDYIIFVGQLHPRKGIHFLIEAMKEIDHLCVIVGDGPQKEYLKKRVTEYGLKNIIFTGSVSRKDLICLYNKAKIFVLPSTAEALPLTILEAMSAGLPVISTNVGAIPEIIKNNSNGLIIEPYNIKDLRNSINKLLEYENKIKEMSKKNKEKASKELDWDHNIKKIIALYRSI